MNESNNNVDSIRNGTYMLIFGVLMFILFLGLSNSNLPIFLEDFKFINSVMSVQGEIYEASAVNECFEEKGCFNGWQAKYTFRPSSNRKVISGDSYISREKFPEFKEDNLPQEVTVEYLPNNSGKNRLKGAGIQTYFELVSHHLGFFIFLMVILYASFFLVISGWRIIWKQPSIAFDEISKSFFVLCLFTIIFLFIATFIFSSLYFINYLLNLNGEMNWMLLSSSLFVSFFSALFFFIKIIEVIENRKLRNYKE